MDSQLVTYKSAGFGPSKPEYFGNLLHKHDFIPLQEDWLRESQFHRIKKSPLILPLFFLMLYLYQLMIIFLLKGEVLLAAPLFGKVLQKQMTPILLSVKKVCLQLMYAWTRVILFYLIHTCESPNNIPKYCRYGKKSSINMSSYR